MSSESGQHPNPLPLPSLTITVTGSRNATSDCHFGLPLRTTSPIASPTAPSTAYHLSPNAKLTNLSTPPFRLPKSSPHS
ncbi:hypothetical protein BDZ91DRAFT_714540 [Kalaharituber pfeilii]|nr:hypothetical protein BDZ91DRAFT_714540 [Kalaharituber pfeilii]